MKSIIPRDNLFFDKFEQVCELAAQGVEELRTLLYTGAPYAAAARRVKTLENESDEVVHSTLEYLHKTFVTPLDRHEIRKLVSRLDDILDLTEAAATRIELYQPKEILQEAKDMVDVLVESALVVKEMIHNLRHLKEHSRKINEQIVEINRLENDADNIRRLALARLFRDGGDLLELIKWKDILEQMETATDACEDVADLVQTILQENT